jgi:hypothetical protein
MLHKIIKEIIYHSYMTSPCNLFNRIAPQMALPKEEIVVVNLESKLNKIYQLI